MKAVYLLPAACLAGILVGSWSAREELRSGLENGKGRRLQAAERKPSGFDAFARMVRIPDTARRPRRRPVKAVKPPKHVTAAVTNAPAAALPEAPPAVMTNAAGQAERPGTAHLSPDDLRARIAEAQELWGTRVDVARAQWKSKLHLAGEAEKAFDAALQEMNEKLYDSVSALAQLLAREDRMTPELGLRLVGDTTTIMAETYDRIGAIAAPEMRGEVSDMQVFDFIDPGVAEPLVDVQGKLARFPLGGR